MTENVVWYKDVSPDARARVSTADGVQFSGMTQGEFKPAKLAFKEAIEADESGKYLLVTVFVEDVTEKLEMKQVREIYDVWVSEGLA